MSRAAYRDFLAKLFESDRHRRPDVLDDGDRELMRDNEGLALRDPEASRATVAEQRRGAPVVERDLQRLDRRLVDEDAARHRRKRRRPEIRVVADRLAMVDPEVG